jgi:hypothetical protein
MASCVQKPRLAMMLVVSIGAGAFMILAWSSSVTAED